LHVWCSLYDSGKASILYVSKVTLRPTLELGRVMTDCCGKQPCIKFWGNK
jgi:hypothetical protein